MKQFYWCGFEVPRTIPQEDMVERWPPNMKGWFSGSSEGADMLCALVWASSADDARATVRSCYTIHADELRERFEPRERGADYRTTERFPATAAEIDALKC